MQVRVVGKDGPQVCSTPRKPISAPRCFGSRAMVRNVSDAARNRISYTTVWFWNAMTSISAAGMVLQSNKRIGA
jgi:hypothetical protein